MEPTVTQPADTLPTLPHTSGGALDGWLRTSALFAEFEKRREIPSDMQDHLLDLFTWGRGWPFAHILELGVRTGNSTSAFLAALETDRRGTLWSVDIAEPDVPPEWHKSPFWSFLKADALTAEAMNWAPPELDVLFLDTDPHSFYQTMAELQAYAPRVRKGGVILVHDTDHPDAAEPALALREYQRIAHTSEREIDLRFKRGCHGLGIMRIR